MGRVSLRNRFWMVSLAIVLSAFLILFLVLTFLVTPPVAERLVRLDEEARLLELARTGGWEQQGLKPVTAAEVGPEQVSVPLGDGRFLVSDRPRNAWEALQVVRPASGRGGLGLLLWVGLLYLLSAVLSNFVNKPILELAEGVRALAQGRRDVQVNVPEEVELADLARAFNQMSGQLAQREKELQEALLARERMFASTSHELRTPLTVILGYCQMLEDGLKGELNPEQRAGVEVVHRNARGLLEQVEMLLLSSRLRAGNLPVKAEIVDLGEILEQLVQDLRPWASGKELELRLTLPDAPIFAPLDPALATQIVRNLLVNAIKFTSRGSVEIAVSREVEFASVSVRDTGPGVEVAFEERLFQEFARGPDCHGIEGTGLGLALSQRLASAMEGKVVLSQNGPDGATFCWRTPCES